MASGFAIFKDAYTRLLDSDAAREFNAVLKTFVISGNMEEFVSALKAVCAVDPGRAELLAIVKTILPAHVQQDFINELGQDVLALAEEQMRTNQLRDVAQRSYDVVYLGSGGLQTVPKAENEADMDIMNAVLSAILKGEHPSTRCRLELTSDSIRTVDVTMSDAIVTTSLEHTVFCGTLNLAEEDKEEVVALVYQDPVYEVVVAHFYLCAKQLAQEIVLAVLGDNAAATTAQSANPFDGETAEEGDGAEDEVYVRLQLDRNRLQHVRSLGAGQFGMVYLANYTRELGKTEQVAVKICRADTKHEDELEFAREADIMRHLRHPRVVELLGVCMEHKPWMLVLEFMPYGNLKSSCLGLKLHLEDREMLQVCRQLADALAYVHGEGFVHMDVASRNVLVGANFSIKLADFGQSQRKDDDGVFVLKQIMRLSVRWMAPETLAGLRKVFSERTDVWSYAVTCWEVYMYGRMPFKSLKTEVARDMIMRGRARLTARPPTTCPKDMWAVLCKCWDYDASQRPSFREISEAVLQLEEKRGNMAPVRDIGKLLLQTKSVEPSPSPE